MVVRFLLETHFKKVYSISDEGKCVLLQYESHTQTDNMQSYLIRDVI